MADFESTPEFQALVVAAAGKPERSMGSSVIPAEPPQWGEVRALANKLVSTNANQLALHIYLIQAETSVKGFTGFRDALQNALTLLSDQWDDMYPEPDLDDPEDMYYARVNLFNELSMQPDFLDAIHKLPLVSVRGLGEFSARDIDISAGTVTGSEEELARCQEGLIKGAFTESDKDALQGTVDALDALPGLCKSVESIFAEKTGQPDVLSLAGLIKRIQACQARCHEYADEHLSANGVDVAESAEPAAMGESAGNEPSASTDANATSSLSDRGMVLASFDAILLYYQQHEPSSPVRVLTFRARDFVDKPFFEVLQALAPAYREDLPMLLTQLHKQPLAAVLSDSYARFLAGEAQPVLQETTHQQAGMAERAPDNMEAEQATAAPSNGSPDGPGDGLAVPVVCSRQDVLAVLHDIETYFTNAEPASPIPLIIADIRKLVSKRFVELVAEFSRLLPAAGTESGV